MILLCEHQETFGLRFEVWSAETELKPAIMAQKVITDSHDNHARHWAAFDGSSMIAAARMCLHDRQKDTPDAYAFREVRLPSPVATINRLVVHNSARRRGLGTTLCMCRIQAAKQDGGMCVVGSAVEPRISSFETLGFRLIGKTAFQRR